MFPQAEGWGGSGTRWRRVAAHLGVAGGVLTAAAALDAIAGLLGATPETVRAQTVPRLRELIADGLRLTWREGFSTTVDVQSSPSETPALRQWTLSQNR